MKKYFVTYDQALALKELGFDEPCFGFYSVLYDLMITQTNGKKSLFELECLAPIKSQVFEWFREKHKISGEPTTYYRGDKAGYGWAIGGQTVPNYYSVLDISSYEEAESACIDKLIELVKNK